MIWQMIFGANLDYISDSYVVSQTEMNSICEIHIWNLYLPLLESQQQIIYEQIY
jgi:hypothetical protein